MTIKLKAKNVYKNGGSEFFWATVLKIMIGIASVLLFPLIGIQLGEAESSKFATLLALSSVCAIIGRLGVDQYISQLVLSYGRLQGRAVRILIFIAALNIFIALIAVLFDVIPTAVISLALAISLSSVVGRIQLALGCGIQSILTTNAVPMCGYYIAAALAASNVLNIEIIPYAASILTAGYAFYALVKVAQKKLAPVPTKTDLRNMPFFSFITSIRSARNESPVMFASLLGLQDVWVLASAQRAINFFEMLQAVMNTVFFRNAFTESKARYVKNWIYIYLMWIAVIAALYGAVQALSPGIFLTVKVFDILFFALAGFMAAMALRYGTVGIRLIHLGKIRAIAAILAVSYLLAALAVICMKPAVEQFGQVWIAAIFSSSLFLSNYLMDRLNVIQD